MAGVVYRVPVSTKFAAPAAVHTLLMAIAPAGHGLRIVEFGISFDGVTASAVPVDVELVQSTQAGAGTPGVSPTPVQIRGRATGGQAPTAGSNYTAEPTVLTSLGHYFVTPNGGLYVEQFGEEDGIESDSSGGTIKGLGIRITPPAIVNVYGYIDVKNV